METEKDLNAKILKVRKFIKDQYPDLYEFIEEIPVKGLSLKNPEKSVKALRTYYDSLHLMLNQYIPQQH
jgi:hypothetical protein